MSLVVVNAVKGDNNATRAGAKVAVDAGAEAAANRVATAEIVTAAVEVAKNRSKRASKRQLTTIM